MLWILTTITTIAAIYWFAIRPYGYWDKKGVKHGKTHYLFGNNLGTTFGNQSFAEMIEEVYKMFPKASYSGFYQFTLPTLLIRDPDLIKQITVKDFDHFLDHRPFVPEDTDPLWAGNLFALTGQRWRDMRTTLSPAFTSSKMKFIFSLISQSGQQFVNYFLKKDQDLITLEMKDTFTRFANDVIANTAFGVECDSLSDRTNEFYLMGREAFDFSGFWKNLKIFLYILIPVVYKFIRIPLFSKKVSDFFNRLVKGNIESREIQGIVRPDMIHLLLEARKGKLKYDETQVSRDTGFATVQESEVGRSQASQKIEMTDQVITSQALVFFFAGFETVSSVMCFMSYELAVNPDIQQRLIQEVDDVWETCYGNPTYEALLSMTYMDMVVSETLRKWPIAGSVDRVCTKPYTIQPKNPNEKSLHLEKNSVLVIPIFAVQRDPQHWPDPDRFDPKRFGDENKGKITPYTYLPFGSGPRNCIGSRFALLEIKTLFFYILSNFEIVPVQKTIIPLRISKKQFNLTAEGGFWCGLKRRIRA